MPGRGIVGLERWATLVFVRLSSPRYDRITHVPVIAISARQRGPWTVVTRRRATTRFPPLAISDSLRPGVYRIGYGPALHMVLRLLAATAEHWLAHQLNDYLQDLNEYRPTPRNLLQLSGTITYTHNITLRLDRPITPKNHPSTHPAHRPTQHPPLTSPAPSPHHDLPLTVAATLPDV
jgi:hypothetical protein